MKVDSILIAKIAGVSQATVSRTFSNPDKVSAKTRQKVLETAESVGYKPDKNASALRRKGSNTILLLYLKRDDGHYWTNIKRNFWIFSEAVLSLTSYFETQHYIFEVKQINSIFSVQKSEIHALCDGVLIFDFVTSDEARYIRSWETPYVLCHRAIHLTHFNHSATDNLGGGSIQGEYLKNKGCSKPVYVMNEEDPFSHDLRLNGFQKIFPDTEVLNSENPEELAHSLSQMISEERLDGAAFVNDMMLVKIVTKLYRRKIDLQDFPLIGYDNSTELQVLDQKPASIEIGISEIYKDAAEGLLNIIRGKIETVHLTHPPKLVPEQTNEREIT